MKYFGSLIKNIDKTLLIIPAIFAVISIVMIGSTAYDGSFNFTRGMKIQLIAFVLGYIGLFITLLFDYQKFERWEKIFYAASIVLLLTVFIPGLGLEQYGSRAWLKFGSITFQPVELVKIAFILFFSAYLSRSRESLDTLKGLASAGLYICPFIGIVVLLQSDLGNALVMCFIAFAMIFVAGVDLKLYRRIILAIAALTPVAYLLMKDYQKKRIYGFFHQNDLSIKENWQVWNSKVAIGSGGVSGKGLFEGTQKELDFLPVQDSDFIFSVIGEELGFLGAAAVILLYALMLYRLFRVATNTKDLYGMLIVYGILAMFFFQIFENIGMTMGVMPVTGITLPFISSGGSSVLMNMIALALALNVCIRSKLINF